MRDSDRLRSERIREAAYKVLRERGYRRASLLEIAKAARVSNQTMYRWYGNKPGLFKSLIEANAQRARGVLEEALATGSDEIASLRELAPLLLTTVTSPRAIDLNRAAAVDASESGELGGALAAAGRGQIVPLVARLIERAHATGALAAPNAEEAAERWVALVIGDLQIRLVTGAIDTPSRAELDARAEAGMKAFVALHSPSATPVEAGASR